MTQVVAFDDIKDTQRVRTDRPDGHFYSTQFIDHSKQRAGAPHVFMIESSQNRILDTHFHDVDQFQVVVGGGGSLGRHTLAPYSVHFARAYTPYGPLVSGPGPGVAYVTLRARACPTGGAQKLPASRAKLDGIAGRQPWQVTGIPRFVAAAANGVGIEPIAALKDDLGLAGYAMTMQAGARTTAPDPGQGDGQCIVILEGSMLHEGREKYRITVVQVSPGEGPFEMVAGSEGLQALVLNFPRPVHAMQGAAPVASGQDKLWQCELCAFAYDEAAGLPEEGIAPGTRWADVPEDWVCPDCSATKKDFTPVDL